MDGRGAAIFREQGTMHVEPAEAGDGQEPCRNNLAVSDDHNRVRRDAFQKILRGFRLDRFRLVDVQAKLERRFFYGRCGDVAAASARPIRLGDYGFDGKFGPLRKLPERRNSEFRRAAKNDAKCTHGCVEKIYQSPVFRSLRIRRLIKSRLSMLRCWMKSIPSRWSIS